MISKIDRKRIYIFMGIAYAITIAMAIVLFLTGGLYLRYPDVVNPLSKVFTIWSMFAPAIANILARGITREGWVNTLLRPNFRRGWPFYLAALFLPALATLVGAAIYYLLFPSRFDLSMTFARQERGMTAVGVATGLLPFILIQTAYAIARSLTDLPVTFGEEFGWRGYLQQKLMPLGPRKAVLLVGAIWAVWHWPGILLGRTYGLGYWGAPWVGWLLFVWCLLPESVFYGWLTIRSGSVWPAAIAHGVSNACAPLMIWFFRGPVQPMDPLIGSSVGVVGSLGFLVLGVLIFFIPGALAPAAGQQPGSGDEEQ